MRPCVLSAWKQGGRAQVPAASLPPTLAGLTYLTKWSWYFLLVLVTERLPFSEVIFLEPWRGILGAVTDRVKYLIPLANLRWDLSNLLLRRLPVLSGEFWSTFSLCLRLFVKSFLPFPSVTSVSSGYPFFRLTSSDFLVVFGFLPSPPSVSCHIVLINFIHSFRLDCVPGINLGSGFANAGAGAGMAYNLDNRLESTQYFDRVVLEGLCQ